jgi:hypothetical protein
MGGERFRGSARNGDYRANHVGEFQVLSAGRTLRTALQQPALQHPVRRSGSGVRGRAGPGR